MVLKLFCIKPSNFFRYFGSGFFKRRFCSAFPEKTNPYKYLLVLDFEATCDRKKKIIQEIIEFPCLKINLETLTEESRFHHYVRPILSPILTDFCVQLTGILQEIVDESQTFPEVYKLFEEWRTKEGLTAENSLYVTSGDWDLGHMIKLQCQLCNIQRPSHMLQWADLKKVFANHEERFLNSFSDLLMYYGLEFEGRPHSGIDDTLNMFRVIKKMIEAGVEFKPTSIVDINTSKVSVISSSSQRVKLKDVSQGPSFSKPIGLDMKVK